MVVLRMIDKDKKKPGQYQQTCLNDQRLSVLERGAKVALSFNKSKTPPNLLLGVLK
jgi:hypothetical protein